MAKNGQIYTIPAGTPFADTLAYKLIEQTQTGVDMSTAQVLLPTRRGVRTLRESFVKLNLNQSVIMPRLQTFGDIDEEALSLSLFETPALREKFQDIPPAMPAMQRQILLARLIMKIEGYAQGYDNALKLAKALAQFLDQIYIEELSFDRLAEIVPESVAQHWQITLTFLEILSVEWPKILNSHAMIDAADRRSKLMNILSAFWQETQPSHPIIAAGSTGSVPATARLLRTIANLPNGSVILPGLDQHMDDKAWEIITPTHPQFGLKTLLNELQIDRQNITTLSPHPQKDVHTRTTLASLMLSPADYTSDWQHIDKDKATKNTIEKALENLVYMPCDDLEQEALSIALIMRETLEKPEKTASLITPDRLLARRVSAILKRWNIEIDDSAGQSLIHQPIGVFLRLTLEACLNNFTPVTLLALLKHPLCALDIDQEHKQALIAQIETLTLRDGLAPPNGVDGIIERLKEIEDSAEHIKLLQRLKTHTQNLCADIKAEKIEFTALIKQHIQTVQSLYDSDKTATQNTLWSGADGQNASRFMADILIHAQSLGRIDPMNYRATFTELLSNITTRPTYGTHPRLKILGQLEARLGQADIMILGGLNEGTWPRDIGHDPWMSQTMCVDFGLPPSERSVGMAAHDFYQAFCAPHIIMTRAERIDGALTIPSRWITRLETILEAANLSIEALKNAPYKYWAKQLDTTNAANPVTRPAPTPPASSRPSGLSVTNIENWLKDPYAIYAKYILNLRPLDRLEKELDAAENGKLLHRILELYAKENPNKERETIRKTLLKAADKAINEMNMHNHLPPFWWPRFHRIIDFLTQQETTKQFNYKILQYEAKGQITVPETGFTLSARVDRIDQNPFGEYEIIDYKSGGQYSINQMADGALPQLPLTGVILKHGGFKDLKQTHISRLSYWVLKGGRQKGEIKTLDRDLEETLNRVEENLRALINAFNDQKTPYLSIPRSEHIPRFNDYEHLARIQEWNAGKDKAA